MTKDNTNAPEQAVDQQQVLRDLLALGKKNGRLSLKEIADALGQLELESDDIDKLYETLENMGVESRPAAFWKRRWAMMMTRGSNPRPSRRSRRRADRHLGHGGNLRNR